jgi:hypothetical protein
MFADFRRNRYSILRLKQFACGGQSPPAPVSRQGFARQILAEHFTLEMP